MKQKFLSVRAEDIIIGLYSLYVTALMLQNTQFAEIFLGTFGIDFKVCVNAVSILCVMAIALVIIAEGKVSRRLIRVGLPLLALAAIVIPHSGRTAQVATLIAFFVAGRYLKTDRVVQQYVLVASVILFVTILLQATGVYYFDSRSSFDGRGERLYLGFLSATTSANYFFYIVLAYFCTRKRITFLETAAVMLLNYLFLHWTKTRAVFAEIVLLLLLLWLAQCFPRMFRGKLFKYSLLCAMPILAASSIFLATAYDPSSRFYSRLDDLLHTRLSLGNKAIQTYGFSLFGHEVTWVTGKVPADEWFCVDCGYLNTAITFGFVILALAILAFTLFAKKAFGERRLFLCVVYLILALRTFSDPQLLHLDYNPMILLAGSVLLTRRQIPAHFESRVKIRTYALSGGGDS